LDKKKIIYSTNIGTEYFKHGIYSPLFCLQNAVCFIILTYLVPVLFTFYIQCVLKFKKIIPAPKGYKTNVQIAKELKVTQMLNKLLEYKRSWIQNVNRMPRNKLPRVMKHYSPTGRRNHDRPLKRLLDT